MTTAIIYTRVSTEEQGHGYSLQTQLESCQAYCASKGYHVAGVFSDMHSGTELDRPELNKAIAAVNELRPDVVVIHDVDRLGRELVVQVIAEQELTRHGARIEFVLGGSNATPEQELLKHMKQAIAVFENRQRVERTRRGMDGRAKAGYPLPGPRPPYGYRYIGGNRSGSLEPDPAEAPVVQQIFSWVAEDGLSSYEVARRLHELGIPRRADQGRAPRDPIYGFACWSPVTVLKILHNPTYKGLWSWGKTRVVRRDGTSKPVRQAPRDWITIQVPALVDEITWERAQQVIAQKPQAARRNARRDYLLRGLIFCPCGRRWTGCHNARTGMSYYRCTRIGKATSPWDGTCTFRGQIRQEALEEAVVETVKAFLTRKDIRLRALDLQRRRQDRERVRITEQLRQYRQELAEIDRKLAMLLDQALTGSFPASLVQERAQALRGQHALLQGKIRQCEERLNQEPANLEQQIDAMQGMVEQAFAKADRREIRRILELLQIRIDVIDAEQVRISGRAGITAQISASHNYHNCTPASFALLVHVTHGILDFLDPSPASK